MAVTLCKSMFPSCQLYSSTTYAQFWIWWNTSAHWIYLPCASASFSERLAHQVSIKPWLSSLSGLRSLSALYHLSLATFEKLCILKFIEPIWEISMLKRNTSPSSKLSVWLYWSLVLILLRRLSKNIWKHFVYWSIFYFKPSLLHISIQRFFTSGYEIISSNE